MKPSSGEAGEVMDDDLQHIAAQLKIGEHVVLPIIEEDITIGKRMVVDGKVRLRKTVHTETVTVDEAGYVERLDVQRVPINQPIDAAPAIREEGNTLIIPIVQEVIVIEKRLMLVEEVRIVKHIVAIHQPQDVELRREEITVERFDDDGNETTQLS
jgi:stress response protein YsnF